MFIYFLLSNSINGPPFPSFSLYVKDLMSKIIYKEVGKTQVHCILSMKHKMFVLSSWLFKNCDEIYITFTILTTFNYTI